MITNDLHQLFYTVASLCKAPGIKRLHTNALLKVHRPCPARHSLLAFDQRTHSVAFSLSANTKWMKKSKVKIHTLSLQRTQGQEWGLHFVLRLDSYTKP
jgi:hypothetical protein